jgi:hypothetical protein
MRQQSGRVLLVGAAVLLLLAAEACAGPATTMSVSVGVAVPAPWGAVTIGTAVPIGYGW